MIGATAFCLVVWVLVQDFGIPGGLGTDPNSMVPWVLLLWTGYRADRPSQPGNDSSPADASGRAWPVRCGQPRRGRCGRHRARCPRLAQRLSPSRRSARFGMALVGVVPLALASGSARTPTRSSRGPSPARPCR